MELTSRSRRLEVATNIAMLVVAILILGVSLSRYFARTENLPPLNTLTRGAELKSLEGVDFGKSRRTLVLFLSTECRFCRESLPFYSELQQADHEHGDKIQIVAVFSNARTEATKFLQQNSLGITAVPGVDYAELGISLTPSIALVDQKRRILDAWTGVLTAKSRRYILDLLR